METNGALPCFFWIFKIGMAALALLVAQSDPNDKDLLIRLTMNMLEKST